MKKIFCFLFALMLMLSVASADTDLIMFSTYGSTEGLEHLFDGDSFALDLIFMLDEMKAVFIETIFESGKFYTKSYPADIRVKQDDSNFLYFVLENDFIIKGHYDDNSVDFWVDYTGGSVKLHSVHDFIKFFDYMGER